MNGTTTTEPALAAVFPDRATALPAFDLLKSQGFTHTWLAVTKRAEGDGVAAFAPAAAATEPSQNDIADSSDGALGAIGRFFSGEGNSLRRSLVDHGVDPVAAAEIDGSLPPDAAVITVFGDGRGALAAQILRENHGRVAGTPTLWDAPTGASASATAPTPALDVTTSRTLVDSVPLDGIPGAYEEIFVERRVVVPPASATPVALDTPRENLGLNDLL